VPEVMHGFGSSYSPASIVPDERAELPPGFRGP
jgi:hypothetical protein